MINHMVFLQNLMDVYNIVLILKMISTPSSFQKFNYYIKDVRNFTLKVISVFAGT